MLHESRLDHSLRQLLCNRRTAALATLQPADGGAQQAAKPMVSFVPYAIAPGARAFLIHVSALAAHTRNLQQQPMVSLLIAAPEEPGQPVHALERVTVFGCAAELAADEVADGRQAYLSRFPEAAPMTALPDFRFVQITPLSARHVAGFGAARDLSAEELIALLEAR